MKMKRYAYVFFVVFIIIIGWYFFGDSINAKKAYISNSENKYNKEITEIEKNDSQDKELANGDIGQKDNQKDGMGFEFEDTSRFLEGFDGNFALEETGKNDASSNQSWWVNSGAFLYVNNGTGKTIFGELEKGSAWQEKYKEYNSGETDTGYHPQNIFRLVTRSKWKNFNQECYYKISRYILSKAKERSESNGILLFNRYQDGDNLYYTGLRVDGTVVVKKKCKGKYYTMAQNQFYAGKYNRKKMPNLLPINKWIGVRSEVIDLPNGGVSIKVYVDNGRTGNWKLVLTAKDNGKSFGGAAIRNEGYAGIRTDFMDVEFDDYKIEEFNQ